MIMNRLTIKIERFFELDIIQCTLMINEINFNNKISFFEE